MPPTKPAQRGVQTAAILTVQHGLDGNTMAKHPNQRRPGRAVRRRRVPDDVNAADWDITGQSSLPASVRKYLTPRPLVLVRW
jgi:hypothetical protein